MVFKCISYTASIFPLYQVTIVYVSYYVPGLISVPSCHSRWYPLGHLENKWDCLQALSDSLESLSFVWVVWEGRVLCTVICFTGNDCGKIKGGKEERKEGTWDKSLDYSTVLRKSQSNYFTHWRALSLLYVISIFCVYELVFFAVCSYQHIWEA